MTKLEKNYTASKTSEADTCSDLNTDSRFPEGKHKNRSNINYSKLISLVHILV